MIQQSTFDQQPTTDDLRKRRQGRLIEQILQRAVHLPDAERRLVEAVYRDGSTITDVARTTMLNAPTRGHTPAASQTIDRNARMIRRRLKRIVARLTHPYALAYFREGSRWTYTRRTVAHAVLVRGMTQRAAARELRVSLHTVRKQLNEIKILVETTSRTGAEW